MARHHFTILTSLSLSLACALSAPAQAQAQRWTAVDLGVVGATPLYGAALNEAGQVVGNYTTSTPIYNTRGFITDANGTAIRALDNGGRIYSGVRAINDAGQVAGDISTASGAIQAFFTGPNGAGITELGAFAAGQNSVASGINNAGQVTGMAGSNTGSHIFVTGPNGVGMLDLGAGAGYDINASGQVTGVVFGLDGLSNGHAFITDANGANLRDIGTLGGSQSNGLAINVHGQVAGAASTGTTSHAFLTGPNGQGMVDLGALAGGASSVAYGMNDAGMTVGDSTTADHLNHAFITGLDGSNAMVDLNSLVTLAAGVYLSTARDINNAGQVVANGSNGHVYLLSAVPEPGTYALMLLGLTGVGLAAARGRARSTPAH
jgi:probable HAF family extracellular repeat protein